MPIRHGQSLKKIEKIGLCLLAAFRRTKRSGSACAFAAGIAKGIGLGLMAVSFNVPQAAASEKNSQFFHPGRSLSAHQVAGTRLTMNARHMAGWVMDSGDNRGMPFAIVDKTNAKVFVFDAHGRLRGAAPALLGLARGDYAVPGIGDRKLSNIRPGERTTPAGRFVASLGYNFNGKDVLWVDYKNAVSLHRVITNNPRERRLERLASPTPLDHRISYGCINVPAKFFDNVVKPTFTGTDSIVYVLPETRSIGEIFKSYYDVESRRRRGATANLYDASRSRLHQKRLRLGRRKARFHGRPERSVEGHKSMRTNQFGRKPPPTPLFLLHMKR